MTKSREGANRSRKRDYRNSDKTAEPMNMKYLFLAKKHIQKNIYCLSGCKDTKHPHHGQTTNRLLTSRSYMKAHAH